MSTPALPIVPRGLTRSLVATGVYTDASSADLTQQVAWSSTDDAVFSISNAAGSRGVATAHSVGSASQAPFSAQSWALPH